MGVGDELSRFKATEDENVPNHPKSIAPNVLREPDVPPPLPPRTEVEHLADDAGPSPHPWEKRAAVGINIESNANANVSDHRASVGVTEIEGKSWKM